MASLWDLHNGRTRRLLWYGYMGAGGVNEAVIAVGGRLMLTAGRDALAVKVFLHPQGAPHSLACRRVLSLVRRLLRDRSPTTYARLLAS